MQVILMIIDVNDNPPEFTKSEYSLNLSEVSFFISNLVTFYAGFWNWRSLSVLAIHVKEFIVYFSQKSPQIIWFSELTNPQTMGNGIHSMKFGRPRIANFEKENAFNFLCSIVAVLKWFTFPSDKWLIRTEQICGNIYAIICIEIIDHYGKFRQIT